MRTRFYAAVIAALFVGIMTPIANAGQDMFTVALIPDTQYYCSPYAPPDIGVAEMYYDLTDWLDYRAAQANIKFAIHLGDLVQNPDTLSEWQIADAAQQTLEWSVPYSVLPGNHDIVQSTGDDTYYNQFFGPQRFAGQSFYGGHEGTKNNNNYCFFEGGGMDFMVLSIEYLPSASTLAWANQVVADHPNHRIIVATHSYLVNEDEYWKYVDGRKPEGNDIWNGLVKGNDNVFMVVSGHVSGWNHRVCTNDYGNPVVEILSDYQWEPDGRSSAEYAGNGWLNVMQFEPTENKIYFRTYSPYLNQWWDDDPLHEYTLDYVMSIPGDANRDGAVDGSDATILANYWQYGVGMTSPDATWAMGDFNGDHVVDGSDATILASHWQEGSDLDTTVPEPSTTTMLLCLAVFGIMGVRRRMARIH